MVGAWWLLCACACALLSVVLSKNAALIVMDVWDAHHCSAMQQWTEEHVSLLNETISRAREAGVRIIHTPSDTMKFYERHPARIRMRSAMIGCSEKKKKKKKKKTTLPPMPVESGCPSGE